MTSTFGWLDADNEQRRRMLEVVDLFKEEGTLDELGIGSILSYDYDDRLLNENALYSLGFMNPTPESRRLNGVKTWRISKRVVSLNYTAASRTGRGASKELLLTTLPPAAVPTSDHLRAVRARSG